MEPAADHAGAGTSKPGRSITSTWEHLLGASARVGAPILCRSRGPAHRIGLRRARWKSRPSTIARQDRPMSAIDAVDGSSPARECYGCGMLIVRFLLSSNYFAVQE